MLEKIKKILSLAVNAPSGDNSQPWRFAAPESELKVFNMPDGDDSVYNFRQRGSFISHGALLENISIISQAEGLKPNIKLFPDGSDPDLIAAVNFDEMPAVTDPLLPAIAERCTNRKPYQKKTLEPAQKAALQTETNKFSDLKFTVIEDTNQIAKLAEALSLNEQLILENRPIHDGLFKFIRWSSEEEKREQTGLYIKTLELLPPQEFAFKLFRKWPLINFLNNFGIAKLVAKDSAKLYAKASAYALITSDILSDQVFIQVGRMLQRIWLSATSQGLSMQPTAALLYLGQRIDAGDTELFSKEQLDAIKTANQTIRDIFASGSDHPLMLFRIGTSAAPVSARSIKRSPIIETL